MGRKIKSQGRDRTGKERDGREKIEQKIKLGVGKKWQKNLCHEHKEEK